MAARHPSPDSLAQGGRKLSSTAESARCGGRRAILGSVGGGSANSPGGFEQQQAGAARPLADHRQVLAQASASHLGRAHQALARFTSAQGILRFLQPPQGPQEAA